MGRIRLSEGTLLDLASEEIACACGVLLSDADIQNIAAKHQISELEDLQRTPARVTVTRPEDFEDAILCVRKAIGNLPDTQPGSFIAMDSMMKLGMQGVDVPRISDAYIQVSESGRFKAVDHEAIEEIIAISGADRRHVYELMVGVGHMHDRKLNFLYRTVTNRQWDTTLRLDQLFKGEHVPDNPEAYLDQRFADYLAANNEEMERMHWRNFERLVTEFFHRKGYEVDLGPGTKDGGVDVRVWTDKDSRTGPPLILVQCKRYKADASVGVESIKAFWTDVEFDQARKGLIATTATVSREGQRVCKARKWRMEFAQAADVQGWARSLWRHVPVLSSSLDPTESATGAETIDLMSRGAVTRFGTLARVFKGGQSELLNGIARLAVLYEDLRVEMGEFRKLYAEIIESGKPGADYRVMYFQRRALATLVEFRGCFTVVLQTKEFKQAKPTLSEMDARFIDGANKYLNDNWARIKELRNEFAGHIKADSVEFGLTRFTDEVGKITWNPDTDAWSTALECDFAGHILAGAISSKLQTGTDVQAELGTAIDVISQGSNHAQGAMLALVHAFVWDRFGGA